MVRGRAPGTFTSTVSSIGTDSQPMRRAARAGKVALRSGVRLKKALMTSPGPMPFRRSISRSISQVASSIASGVFSAAVIAPRIARMLVIHPSVDAFLKAGCARVSATDERSDDRLS